MNGTEPICDPGATCAKPRSVGPRCGDPRYALLRFILAKSAQDMCVALSVAKSPCRGGGVMPEACLRHDDARRPAALIPRGCLLRTTAPSRRAHPCPLVGDMCQAWYTRSPGHQAHPAGPRNPPAALVRVHKVATVGEASSRSIRLTMDLPDSFATASSDRSGTPGGNRCRPRPSRDQGSSARPTPPTPATITTAHGGAFHAISRTKHPSASAKSRMSPMALVNTGE